MYQASAFAVMKSNPITSKSALFTGAPPRPPRLYPTPLCSPPRHRRLPPIPHRSFHLSSRFVKARDAKASYSETEVEDELNEEACELVNGAELTIGEGDDAVNAHLFKAVKNNNGTGIILLSDIFGFEDSFTRDFAYRVACNGFNVLVPDLFRGDPWAREKPRELFGEWLALQDSSRVAKDINISTKWMTDELVAAGISKKLGLIGFWFGGARVVEVLARDETSRFATGVSFYGTRMDSSHAANVKVPILFLAGDEDPLCPSDILKKFEEVIGRGSKAVIFKGRGHGFAHRPETPEDDADAEQAFSMMRNWFYEKLAVGEEVPAS
ncbi:Carboxymethylenebutenolidase-like protein [Drosera capensis]